MWDWPSGEQRLVRSVEKLRLSIIRTTITVLTCCVSLTQSNSDSPAALELWERCLVQSPCLYLHTPADTQKAGGQAFSDSINLLRHLEPSSTCGTEEETVYFVFEEADVSPRVKHMRARAHMQWFHLLALFWCCAKKSDCLPKVIAVQGSARSCLKLQGSDYLRRIMRIAMDRNSKNEVIFTILNVLGMRMLTEHPRLYLTCHLVWRMSKLSIKINTVGKR